MNNRSSTTEAAATEAEAKSATEAAAAAAMGRLLPSYPFLLMICIFWFITNFIFFSELKWSTLNSGEMMSRRHIGLGLNESEMALKLAAKLDRLEQERYKLGKHQDIHSFDRIGGADVKHMEHLLPWQKLLQQKLKLVKAREARKKKRIMELMKRRKSFQKLGIHTHPATTKDPGKEEEKEEKESMADKALPSNLTNLVNNNLVKADKLSPAKNDMNMEVLKKGLESTPKVNVDKHPLLLEPPGDYPGKDGRPVNINVNSLTDEQKHEFNQGWKHNQFNQYASDQIPLNRNVGDVRDPECANVVYSEDLPKTSVIICFHNEAWSTLLRTVHSVLRNTQLKYLEEIILVDDFSSFHHLKEPLEDYVKMLPKVRIVRSKKREGLIRARLIGYNEAKGEVLTYLDSHCECTKDWLRPMLQRIVQNPMAAVIPVIDRLDENNFEYIAFSGMMVNIGIFKWDLTFNWAPVPRAIRDTLKSATDAIKSPTMAGGLFSIRKDTFTKLGTYDPGFDTWGGENLELSFKVWMCGGSLEIMPCSHVGHVFRSNSPYSWPKGMTELRTNGIRLAEVWLDSYKEEYYKRLGYVLGNYGDVSERKKLRNHLHCASFDWYLHNIYPEALWIKEAVIVGPLMNRLNQNCLLIKADNTLLMVSCNVQEPALYNALTKTGEIRIDGKCLAGTNQIYVLACNGQKGMQEWQIQASGHILHVVTNQCLDIGSTGKIVLNKCFNSPRQMWTFLQVEKPKKN